MQSGGDCPIHLLRVSQNLDLTKSGENFLRLEDLKIGLLVQSILTNFMAMPLRIIQPMASVYAVECGQMQGIKKFQSPEIGGITDFYTNLRGGTPNIMGNFCLKL